ncbi:MAG: GntR family transcriptional regulator, partial [Chloroflexota bacterium]|nr:GntR family transcriptional regulator [Chloroflexota bacterium]
VKPGQRLVESTIAADLGVGRNAVREALQHLAQQGIVVGSAYKGMRVADLGPQQVEEVYSLRAALESFATLRALERGQLTDDVLDDLRGLVAEMEVASRVNSVTRMVELDTAFHDRVTSCADHALVTPILKGLRQQVRIIIALSSRGSGLPGMVESHRTLLKALETRESRTVEAATRAHILESGDLLARLRAE